MPQYELFKSLCPIDFVIFSLLYLQKPPVTLAVFHARVCYLATRGVTIEAMIQVFIDESGNMGRGGKYFVLAAVVFDTPKGATRVKRIIHKEQQRVAKEASSTKINELKSYQLTFSQRQRILSKMTSKADVDIFYLVVDKPFVTLLQQGKPKNLVYNYFAKLLTDEIFKKYNGDFRVIFDQRTTTVKSMNSLVDYISLNAYTSFDLVRSDVTVLQKDSKTENNLQAADLVAGTIYRAYDRGQPHFLQLIHHRVVNASEFPQAKFQGSLKNCLK